MIFFFYLLAPAVRLMSSKVQETDAEFDARYEAFFNRPDIDGWEIRKAMGDLAGMDLVPEPTIVAAALRACRRINDYSLTTRILEVVKMKCAYNEKELWPYMMQVKKDNFFMTSYVFLGHKLNQCFQKVYLLLC